ncbi:hypothetical protein CRYUN_Cryun07bG0025000 [Craigia yunnanensis]
METEAEKQLNDWLPITKSRNAKWWYSAFHNVTAMVGAGVLGLPYAMYHELGQHAFGEKLGLWVVVPQQLMVEVGVNIVYVVTGEKSLKKIYDTARPNGKDLKTTYFIMMFGSIHFFLSHLPSFNSITCISFAAALMSISYSTIAWTTSLHKGVQPTVKYTLRSSTSSGEVFDFFAALGDVAFAFAGHNVVLEIQATIPSSPVVDNVLITLEKPALLIIAANAFVVIHVIIFAVPVFDMIESYLVKQMHFKPNLMLRFTTRTSYVVSLEDMLLLPQHTMEGIRIFPFSSNTLNFIMQMPNDLSNFLFIKLQLACIMWLAIYKPKRFSLSWFSNWICIILGFLLMILAPIGGLRMLILQSKKFKFYS